MTFPIITTKVSIIIITVYTHKKSRPTLTIHLKQMLINLNLFIIALVTKLNHIQPMIVMCSKDPLCNHHLTYLPRFIMTRMTPTTEKTSHSHIWNPLHHLIKQYWMPKSMALQFNDFCPWLCPGPNILPVSKYIGIKPRVVPSPRTL